MPDISRAALFGKLDPLAWKAIEGATAFCKLRGNPYVELQHWLFQILHAQDSDLHRIARHFDLDAAALERDLQAALDRLPRGASSITDLSAFVEDAVERAWVYGSLMFGGAQVRTGFLVIGMLKTRALRSVLMSLSRQFERVSEDDLVRRFHEIVEGSPETPAEGESMQAAAGADASTDPMAPTATGKPQALARYAVDLTERARQGEIDPVTGRDEEIRQVVDVLMRRRQNNPILTGEAGVGKTAVVEGFALRLARGDVPPQLRDVRLMMLDVGLLQAGASMKGEFESRLRQVIDEVQASPKPVILFIDEAHTLIGAGGAAGTGDAANLLKPALARGKLRTIAATTWAEYKRHVEKDPALTRRFQVVHIDEPDEARAVRMLRGVAAVLEKHHRVLLLDEAIEAAVRLSHRYIPARQLPDKAVSLLDTACARVAVSQHATPPELEDVQRRIEALEEEAAIIGREADLGIEVGSRRARVDAERAAADTSLQALQARLEQERGLVDAILALRARLRRAESPAAATPATGATSATVPVTAPTMPGDAIPAPATQSEAAPSQAALGPPLDDAERTRLQADLQEVHGQLARLQGDRPLILPSVDSVAVGSVVQDWTGIPVGRMVKDEIQSVLKLADTLNERVIGQGHAMETIARRIQTSRARLDNPDKPVGVFLLAGTSGVGKTETALALAEALYGGEQNVITINMSEFQEAHTVSTLKGAPPGYVGYGEGGVLTEAVRRRPYSVVLLDEVEKAHPDVHELFFQVFDKGRMEDGEGRRIDFRNTIILLTSNVGSEQILHLCREGAPAAEPETIAKALREPLLRIFPAALLGRMVTVPYYPLDEKVLGQIVRLQLDRIRRRVQANHGLPFEYDDDVVGLVVRRCHEVESGGRVIDALLTNTVLPRISHEYLSRLASEAPMRRVALSVRDEDFVYAFD